MTQSKVRGVSTFLEVYFGLGKMCFQDMRGHEDPSMFCTVARAKTGDYSCFPRSQERRAALDVLDYYTPTCDWTNKRTSSYVQHLKSCGQELEWLLLSVCGGILHTLN